MRNAYRSACHSYGARCAQAPTVTVLCCVGRDPPSHRTPRGLPLRLWAGGRRRAAGPVIQERNVCLTTNTHSLALPPAEGRLQFPSVAARRQELHPGVCLRPSAAADQPQELLQAPLPWPRPRACTTDTSGSKAAGRGTFGAN